VKFGRIDPASGKAAALACVLASIRGELLGERDLMRGGSVIAAVLGGRHEGEPTMLRSREVPSHEPVDRAASEPEEAAGSFGKQSSKILRDVHELGAIAVENVGRTMGQLKAKGRGVVRKSCDRATRVQDGFARYVASNPTKSLLIALGVGALLGVILRRRASSSAPVQDVG
jgi:ElaB/YqjD/DUF883 family membrane-anchored ribosome-binding protein